MDWTDIPKGGRAKRSESWGNMVLVVVLLGVGLTLLTVLFVIGQVHLSEVVVPSRLFPVPSVLS